MQPKSFLILWLSICLFAGCDERKTSLRPPQEEPRYSTGDVPEFGGTGFAGKDWENAEGLEPFGDPKAVKGGTLKIRLSSYPATLRFVGKDTNSRTNSILQGLMYETLLKLHPGTLECIPSLATHWQILRDQKTFRFRLDPKARWADGTPVTCEDVIASWKLRIDPGLESPDTLKMYEKFSCPVAESTYIVHVTTQELDWQLFLNFATGMYIYPASVLKEISGKEYMAEYNEKVMMGSGPYRLVSFGMKTSQDLCFERRSEHWAKSERFTEKLYNFDKIQFIIEPDSENAFQRFKKGEYDIYSVNVSSQWIQSSQFDEIKRGIIQRRKIFNKAPQGFSGVAFNMRKPPFDDILVRKAFVHLFNRERLIEKFFHNEYIPIDSYYPGGLYANPDNPRYRYDPKKARELFTQAGYKMTEGKWVSKEGVPMGASLLSTAGMANILKIYQEDLQKEGVELRLEIVKPQELLQNIMRQQFQMAIISWTGEYFPDPENAWESTLADKPHSFNICGVKSEKIDRICKVYRRMFLQRQRVSAIREIDDALMKLQPYALGWGKDYERILYFKKFGYPQGHLSKTGDFWDVLSVWWIDPAKEDALQKTISAPAAQLERGEVEQRYWLQEKES